ncbi:hypothetical protein D6D29_09885 [Aureobasidium pullulans]|nr:hypothetical protein D6D29_09885 [Aureobasidium pullulans]
MYPKEKNTNTSFLHFDTIFTMAAGVVILIAISVKAMNERTLLLEDFESNTRKFVFDVNRASWIRIWRWLLCEFREPCKPFWLVTSPSCTHVLLVCVEACLMCVAREEVCFDQTVPGVFGIAFDFVSPLIGFLDAGLGQIDAPFDIYVVTNHEGVT